MIHKSTYPAIVSIIGLIVVLGIDSGFDALMRFLSYQRMEMFFLNSVIFWCYALIALLLAAILLLLAWLVLINPPRNAWISLVFLIIGSFIVFYPALYYNPTLAIGRWLPGFDTLLSYTSYFSFSGGFIAIIGLFALVFRGGKWTDSK
jgi:hypothetical protein